MSLSYLFPTKTTVTQTTVTHTHPLKVLAFLSLSHSIYDLFISLFHPIISKTKTNSYLEFPKNIFKKPESFLCWCSGGGQLKHENTVIRADGAVVSSSNSSTASKSSSTNLSAQKQDIVRVTQTLLDAISCKDFDTYTRLCDTSMTCFEPEALGNLIEGIEFHRFYFDGNRKNQVHTTMLNPNVHIIGEDAACVAYVKLTQFLDRNGEAHTRQSQESRVWSKKQGRWVCVHVHRSTQPSTNTTVSEF
ncbi:hypothetical protein L5515_012137 [Caenorhabditis briggsae]|uniref:Calcium/calmodulin-dependent protein kinase II association-domain domain-containing protein n=1 Tax=Caenorhabditis briggsae TaxID=6238 RepID=A0AAE9JHX8_CAEBR|nr:hypothetical protein L5515_012137 [Caenorhabditis briggsae]